MSCLFLGGIVVKKVRGVMLHHCCEVRSPRPSHSLLEGATHSLLFSLEVGSSLAQTQMAGGLAMQEMAVPWVMWSKPMENEFGLHFSEEPQQRGGP